METAATDPANLAHLEEYADSTGRLVVQCTVLIQWCATQHNADVYVSV
jgi:hypothetical protein